MKLTLAVIAYNEEEYLEQLFSDMAAQDYPHECLEILLVDGQSTDSTRKKMEKFAEEYGTGFLNIKIIETERKNQAASWNTAIRHFTTEVMIRIDAHASIPHDFVSKNVRNLEKGEMVSGGYRPNRAVNHSAWQRVLLAAESSMFGSSIASYRRKGEKNYVKSLFHGAYRREVLEKTGGFDETLGRTEDNEFHFRIRQAGYRLCFDPDIVSYQYIRASLGKMCRQKAGNGFWVGTTLGVCPGCLSFFHFVPACFLGGIVLTTALGLAGFPVLAYIMWILYWLCAMIMAAAAVRSERKCPQQLLLPFLFFLLHLSYGAGTFAGLVYLPFFRKKHRNLHKRTG